MSAGFERKGLKKPANGVGPSTPSTFTQAEAKQSGYTGSLCDVCGSARMRIAGHCMVCEECGTTTGCS